jgi:hypothetical protein
MKPFSVLSCAAIGALTSLYSAVCAGISLFQGVFRQDWGSMEMPDVSPELQSPRLVELLHTAHESSHAAIQAFSSVASMAQESTTRTLSVNIACFLLFCAIAAMDYCRSSGKFAGPGHLSDGTASNRRRT